MNLKCCSITGQAFSKNLFEFRGLDLVVEAGLPIRDFNSKVALR